LFLLDEARQPIVVAGVPPDYFSETGQRWGNPLYNWKQMERDGFRWWMRRFASMQRLVDIVRIDHFRGFEACWSIPVTCPTAIEGEWVKSPGRELFTEFNRQFRNYPILAEDLGLITPEVEQLRQDFEFPGMRVLQFGFSPYEPNTNQFLPHHYEHHTVAYTGTHDNDTTRGWFESESDETRQAVLNYLGYTTGDIAWDLMRLTSASVAQYAIFPMQDLLSLGSRARMNTPSTFGGNWSWRLEPGQLAPRIAERLADMTSLYGRCNTPIPAYV
jgi:4-alpha-glucanotransferase